MNDDQEMGTQMQGEYLNSHEVCSCEENWEGDSVDEMQGDWEDEMAGEKTPGYMREMEAFRNL